MEVTTTMTTAMMDISLFEFLIVFFFLLEGALDGSTHGSRVVERPSFPSLLTFAFGVGVCGR